MSVDVIGNFLTVIRNGVMTSKPFVSNFYTKMRAAIAQILQDEGFIRGFEVIEDATGKKTLKVYLKYVDGESVIHELRRISTPGRRVYTGAHEVKHVIGGLGISILTTNRGIITDKRARQQSVGGEIICKVW